MYISVVAGLQSVKYLYLSKVNLVHTATVFCITEGGDSSCFYPLDVLGESLDEKFVVLAAESTISLHWNLHLCPVCYFACVNTPFVDYYIQSCEYLMIDNTHHLYNDVVLKLTYVV